MDRSFILLTNRDDKTKVLYAINKIISFFVDTDGSTFVEVENDKGNGADIYGFTVEESIEEITCLLSESGLAIC